MKEIEIAFIGGSGLYKIPNFRNSRWINIKSNFGSPSSKICVGTLNNKNIAFFGENVFYINEKNNYSF